MQSFLRRAGVFPPLGLMVFTSGRLSAADRSENAPPKPAELIITDGPPRFAAVKGTKLEYIENTTANVFKEPTDDEFYVLTAGRWLRAWTFDGPWEFVSRADLPADIAAISDSSPILTRRRRPSR